MYTLQRETVLENMFHAGFFDFSGAVIAEPAELRHPTVVPGALGVGKTLHKVHHDTDAAA
jgi:hypothetical protein